MSSFFLYIMQINLKKTKNLNTIDRGIFLTCQKFYNLFIFYIFIAILYRPLATVIVICLEFSTLSCCIVSNCYCTNLLSPLEFSLSMIKQEIYEQNVFYYKLYIALIHNRAGEQTQIILYSNCGTLVAPTTSFTIRRRA